MFVLFTLLNDTVIYLSNLQVAAVERGRSPDFSRITMSNGIYYDVEQDLATVIAALEA